LRKKYADWFGTTVSREQAFSAFDTAVRDGRLVPSRERNNAQYYRVKPAATASDDLTGGVS
jgi:hypothetical protein